MFNYKNHIFRRVFKYSSPLISLFEKSKINYYGKNKSKYFPIFILGVPRTGSTILYQFITAFFNISYIDNLINLSRQNLFFGFWLSNRIFKNKSHNSFSSSFGNTQQEGLHAPSEAGQVWYEWLPKGDVVLNKNSVSDKKKKSFKKNILAILNKYEKPLIIKNLYFNLRIKLLYEIFPTAKFIIIKRNPLYIAQSLYIGRKKNNDNINKWWSIKPKNFEDLSKLNVYDQIAGQIYYLEQQLYNDIALYSKENILEVSYENLNKFSIEDLNKLKKFLGTDIKVSDMSDILGKIKIKNDIRLDVEIIENIKQAIEKYNWDKNKLKWGNI